MYYAKTGRKGNDRDLNTSRFQYTNNCIDRIPRSDSLRAIFAILLRIQRNILQCYYWHKHALVVQKRRLLLVRVKRKTFRRVVEHGVTMMYLYVCTHIRTCIVHNIIL